VNTIYVVSTACGAAGALFLLFLHPRLLLSDCQLSDCSTGGILFIFI